MRRSISSILRGVITRTRNVSEYMLVLALCLVEYCFSTMYDLNFLADVKMKFEFHSSSVNFVTTNRGKIIFPLVFHFLINFA